MNRASRLSFIHLSALLFFIALLFQTQTAKADSTWAFIKVGAKYSGLGLLGVGSGIALIASAPVSVTAALASSLLISGGLGIGVTGVAVAAVSPLAADNEHISAKEMDRSLRFAAAVASPAIAAAPALVLLNGTDNAGIDCTHLELTFFEKYSSPIWRAFHDGMESVAERQLDLARQHRQEEGATWKKCLQLQVIDGYRVANKRRNRDLKNSSVEIRGGRF